MRLAHDLIGTMMQIPVTQETILDCPGVQGDIPRVYTEGGSQRWEIYIQFSEYIHAFEKLRNL